MAGREFHRIPYSVEVQFRTASSFLVAYSVNLSRGGIFLETANILDPGTELQLQIEVPGTGTMKLRGQVTWCRETAGPDGPRGMGVEFHNLDHSLGAVIDRLVSEFAGVNILMASSDELDRNTLAKMIRQIIGTSEVIVAADMEFASKLLGDDIDLMVIDIDSDPDGSISTIQAAKSGPAKVPVIALASTHELRERARSAGADEVSSNPPPSAEFQRILVQALGKPTSVRN